MTGIRSVLGAVRSSQTERAEVAQDADQIDQHEDRAARGEVRRRSVRGQREHGQDDPKRTIQEGRPRRLRRCTAAEVAVAGRLPHQPLTHVPRPPSRSAWQPRPRRPRRPAPPLPEQLQQPGYGVGLSLRDADGDGQGESDHEGAVERERGETPAGSHGSRRSRRGTSDSSNPTNAEKASSPPGGRRERIASGRVRAAGTRRPSRRRPARSRRRRARRCPAAARRRLLGSDDIRRHGQGQQGCREGPLHATQSTLDIADAATARPSAVRRRPRTGASAASRPPWSDPAPPGSP